MATRQRTLDVPEYTRGITYDEFNVLIDQCDCCEESKVKGTRHHYRHGPRDCETEEMCNECLDAGCDPYGFRDRKPTACQRGADAERETLHMAPDR